jgi:hypothetical protein
MRTQAFDVETGEPLYMPVEVLLKDGQTCVR